MIPRNRAHSARTPPVPAIGAWFQRYQLRALAVCVAMAVGVQRVIDTEAHVVLARAAWGAGALSARLVCGAPRAAWRLLGRVQMSVVIGMLAFAAGPTIIGYSASGADAAPAPLTMQHRVVEGLLGATRHMPSHVQYAAQALVRCLLYTSPSPRDGLLSRMPSSA